MVPQRYLTKAFASTTPSEKSYSEVSRKFRRTYYTEKDWLRHRSSDRFIRNLLTIFESGVARQLSKEVMSVAAVSIGVVVWNTYAQQNQQNSLPVFCLPIDPFTLSSPALGLLLVFRTNSSYSRWLDGRKAWGSIVNNCRSILRMTFSWSNEKRIDDDVMERLAVAVWLVPRSLQRHLYGDDDADDYEREVRERLPPDLAQAMLDACQKPTRAQYELSSAIEELPLEYLRRLEVEKGTIELCNACGSCERIFSSPVPLLYTRHTARFLALFLLLLPLALYPKFESSWNHVAMIPASMLIAFFFFGIEELSVQLEEPFSILPLQTLIDGIDLSGREHVQWYKKQLEEKSQTKWRTWLQKQQ